MTDQQRPPDVRIVELAPQPSVAVRVRQPMSGLDLAALYDRYLPLIAGRLPELGAVGAGPPYGRYHEFGPDQVDVEIGFPVAEPVAALPPLGAAGDAAEPAELGASALPGGPVAVCVHLGPYDSLQRAYEQLTAHVQGQGRKPGAGPWESYVDNPAEVSDPAALRTDVCWPVD